MVDPLLSITPASNQPVSPLPQRKPTIDAYGFHDVYVRPPGGRYHERPHPNNGKKKLMNFFFFWRKKERGNY
jgi:hypothetical protein